MIVQAACAIAIDGIDGIQIIPLHRHGDIGKILASFGFQPGKGYRIIEQGFLDEHGVFFDRRKAWYEAATNGQVSTIERRAIPELFSEDIY